MEAWPRRNNSHANVTKDAHRLHHARWWGIFERRHRAEMTVRVDCVKSGRAATLAPWGVGFDPEVLFLHVAITNWYGNDSLHVSVCSNTRQGKTREGGL